jgi:hypothetical protein
MDLFELARIITVKMKGDVNDFLDYAIILRKWMDINYTLSEELMKGLNVSQELAFNDNRFKTLRDSILQKPLHNKRSL